MSTDDLAARIDAARREFVEAHFGDDYTSQSIGEMAQFISDRVGVPCIVVPLPPPGGEAVYPLPRPGGGAGRGGGA